MLIRLPLDLGQLVRTRRLALGWSQEHLAGLAEVGRTWVLELEQGKSKNGPPLALVMRTLTALGCMLDVIDDVPARLGPGNEPPAGRASRDGQPRKRKGKPPPNVVPSRCPVSADGIGIAIALDEEEFEPARFSPSKSPDTPEINRDDVASAEARQSTGRPGKPPKRSAAQDDAGLEDAVRACDYGAVMSAFLADLLNED